MSEFFGYFYDPLDIVQDVLPDTPSTVDVAERRGKPKPKRRPTRVETPEFAQLVAVPGNLPNHTSGQTAQSGWVKEKIDNGVDVLSIAECSNELGAAIRGRNGVHFTRAQYNFGGNGNAFATSVRPYYRGGYGTHCRVEKGPETFHMARVKIAKHGIKTGWDGVHIPSTNGFLTSADDRNRRAIVNQIARNKMGDVDARFAMGDWNGQPDWVLSELHKIDKRWEYFGGIGVMLAFGINANVMDKPVIACPVSDHKTTVRLKIKVKN